MKALKNYKYSIIIFFFYSNAVVVYCKKKGISPVVNISASDTGKEFLFTIKDNGIGIEKEYYDRIFIIGGMPFFLNLIALSIRF